MMTDTSLLEISKRYLFASVYGTGGLILSLSILSLPILFASFSEPELFTYTVIGVIGWAVYFGQETAIQRINSPDQETNDYNGNFLDALAGMVYFNTVLFITVILGLTVTTLANPFVGLLIASVYPIYDTETANRNLPFSFGGTAAFSLVAFSTIWRLISEASRWVDWDTLQYDQLPINLLNVVWDGRRPRPR